MKTKDIADLLYHFFIQNCSLSLPGIGTFDMFRISAQTDFANKKILPPSFIISYDSIHDAPNKELFDYVSRKKNVTEWEAIKLVNDFAFDLKNTLKNGEEIEWEGIGMLKSGLSGDIVFEPYRLSYEFIPHVGAQRVIRKAENHHMLVGDRQLSKSEMQQLLANDTVEIKEKESWWIYAAIIAAIAISLIAIRLFTSDSTYSTGRQQHIIPSDQPSTYSNLP